MKIGNISTYNDIIGLDVLKRRVGTRFRRFISGDWNKRKHTKKPHGIALSGPPGVGKSFFWEATIGEYTIDNPLFEVIKIDKGNVGSKDNNGETKLVNSLFDTVRDNPNTIFIFNIEEADDVFISRKGVKRAHANELTSAWIKNMEGYDAPPNYYIFATTNYIENWDEAVTSRLEYVYDIGYPDRVELAKLYIKYILDDFEICKGNNDTAIHWANHSKELTPRDIVHIANRLEDIEFEIHEKDPNSILSILSVDYEITQQQLHRKRMIAGYKDNWKEEW